MKFLYALLTVMSFASVAAASEQTTPSTQPTEGQTSTEQPAGDQSQPTQK